MQSPFESSPLSIGASERLPRTLDRRQDLGPLQLTRVERQGTQRAEHLVVHEPCRAAFDERCCLLRLCYGQLLVGARRPGVRLVGEVAQHPGADSTQDNRCKCRHGALSR